MPSSSSSVRRAAAVARACKSFAATLRMLLQLAFCSQRDSGKPHAIRQRAPQLSRRTDGLVWQCNLSQVSACGATLTRARCLLRQRPCARGGPTAVSSSVPVVVAANETSGAPDTSAASQMSTCRGIWSVNELASGGPGRQRCKVRTYRAGSSPD